MEWIIFRLEFNCFEVNWPLAFCFSVRFQMGEAQKWSKDEILSRFSASFWPPRFWDLVEISTRISTRFWDLGENLGESLATEILRSRQHILDEILRSRRDVGENLGEFLATEILRSRRWDLGNLAGQKLAEILAEISVKILQGHYSVIQHGCEATSA